MLGDRIATALERVGITPERVEAWVGFPCGCEERQIRLNQLHAWASRVLRGKVEQAERFLNEILGQ